jgi:putative ABC transport system permease protein
VLSSLGIVAGLVVALAASNVMQKLLFGVPSRDTLTFAVVAALLAGVAVIAACVPGLRATRVDPLSALRGE